MVVPFLTGQKQITIDLPEPVVILRGRRKDKATQILQGEVKVVLHKPTTVSKLSISFVGKSTSYWPEGIGARGTKYSHVKTIHREEQLLQLFEDDFKANTILQPGVYRWPFQFILSSELVETIEYEFSKVSYYLSAKLDKSGRNIWKIKAKRDILILRIPDWSNRALAADSLPTNSIVSDRQLDKCNVNLYIEKPITSSGTLFPVAITLIPTQKHLFLENILVMLVEKKVYRLDEYQVSRSDEQNYKLSLLSATNLMDPAFATSAENIDLKEIKRLLSVKNYHLPLDKTPFQYLLNFSLPNCRQVGHSTAYSDFSVRHFIHITINFSTPNQEDFQVHFETPITILDCRLKEDFHTLPTYQEIDLSAQIEKGGAPDKTASSFFICPCYLEYKKKCHGSMIDWMNIKNTQPPYPSPTSPTSPTSSISFDSNDSIPPPSYDQLQS